MAWLHAFLLFTFLTAFGRTADGRSLLTADTAVATPGRQLQQSAPCPDGCAAGQCVQNGTAGSQRCLQCVNNLLVSSKTGLCVCPAGRFSALGEPDCRDCRKGSWCPGGPYVPSAQPPQVPSAIDCPQNMTTVGVRSISIRACVNLPGFYYTLDSNNEPGTVECPMDSYGPGFKKQRGCVPCPTGFTTNSRVQQARQSSCVVPAGYYLTSPIQVTPCPPGKWKAEVGTSANCTQCADGVTTPREASTSESECRLLLPGFFAQEMRATGAIIQTQLCPQGYFCPGAAPNSTFDPRVPGSLSPSEPSIKACAGGLSTREVGSVAAAQCVVRAGYYLTTEGQAAMCPRGEWRADNNATTSCTKCAQGVTTPREASTSEFECRRLLPGFFARQMNANGTITQAQLCPKGFFCPGVIPQSTFDPSNPGSLSPNEPSIRSCGGTRTTWVIGASAADNCVVGAGYYLTAEGQAAMCPRVEWRADSNATTNCTKCADGVTTPRMASISELECRLLLPGFFARVKSTSGTIIQTQLCPQGYFCPGAAPNSTFDPSSPGSLSPSEPSIKSCGSGLSTREVGSIAAEQCFVRAGYYLTSDGQAAMCPRGEWSADSKVATNNSTVTSNCTKCAEGVTTPSEASTSESECRLLLPGFFAREMSSNGTIITQAQLCPQGYFCPGAAPNSTFDPSSPGSLSPSEPSIKRCAGGLSTREVGSVAAAQCFVRAGYYLTSEGQAAMCPRGEWRADSNATTNCTKCADGVTTASEASTSEAECKLLLPGFFARGMSSNGTIITQAQLCPQGYFCPGAAPNSTFDPSSPGSLSPSEPSIKRCGGGLSTREVGSTAADQCVVRAGYYLTSDGQTAMCPRGQWRGDSNATTNCTRCFEGVTTPSEASISESECRLLLPGFFALKLNASGTIAQAQLCPQGYFCPGAAPNSTFDPSSPGSLAPSEPSIKRCPNGMWTLGVGSVAVEQCLTPPGFFTANGTTQPCPEGSFRANWTPNAVSCTSCGVGVKVDKTDRISVVSSGSNSVTFLPVSTSSNDCFIQPGQGLYALPAGDARSGGWIANNCDNGTYGVSNITYGLSPSPCRACPAGQLTSTNATQYPISASYFVRNPDGSGGFVSEKACVNPAGYENVNGTVRPCPKGTYNPLSWSPGTTTTCTPCPIHTTTGQEGATSVEACLLCVGGYGGNKCLTQCGGVGFDATYGPTGRPVGSPCLPCSTSNTGFSFEWQLQINPFTARAISRPGADKGCDCLTEYQQLVDRAWYIRTNATQAQLLTGPKADSFAACVELCTKAGPGCMWATYNYASKGCYTRMATPSAGAPIVGIKALPSGNNPTNGTMAVSPASCRQLSADSGQSGAYSFHRDAAAADILGTEPAPGRESFTSSQDCITVCDKDDKCAGVILQDVQNKAKTCTMIKGDLTLGTFIRTATRTDVTRLAFPGVV